MTIQDVKDLYALAGTCSIVGGIFMIVILVKSFRDFIKAEDRHRAWLAQYPPVTGPPGPSPYVGEGPKKPPACVSGCASILLPITLIGLIIFGALMIWIGAG